MSRGRGLLPEVRKQTKGPGCKVVANLLYVGCGDSDSSGVEACAALQYVLDKILARFIQDFITLECP